MTKKRIQAPEHLSENARKWWSEVVSGWELEEHHLRILTMAAEAWDRAVEARERIASDGAYVRDRFNQLRAHPGVAVERDSRIAFARLLRELDLDVAPPESRVPHLQRYKR